jgi:uncharacterized DUF497 family protein
VRLLFEWDAAKADANLAKHGVAFTEAATVLGDPLSVTVPDPDHSVGASDRLRFVVVAHTEIGDHIRIISARELTRSERKSYERRD